MLKGNSSEPTVFQHTVFKLGNDGRVAMSEDTMKKIILWHRRLCHPSTERLIWTIKRSCDIDLKPEDVEALPCTACDMAKMKKFSSKDAQERSTYVGEIIWCDVGMIQPVSLRGNSYYSLIVEDHSRYRDMESMKTKGGAQQHLRSYIKKIIRYLANQPPGEDGKKKVVRVLRLDGGREFGMSEMGEFCEKRGIELRLSSPYNQYQNGAAERAIEFMQDEARACVVQMRIPTCFWDYVMEAVVETTNRTGQSPVKGMAPAEIYWKGLDPDGNHPLRHEHLYILGSRCVVLIDQKKRVQSEKLAGRGTKGIFLGYEGESNYIVWLTEGGRFLTTPHVTVYEDLTEPGAPPDPRDIVRSLPKQVQKRLRHRTGRKDRQKVDIQNDDDNVVSDDETDKEDKEQPIKRKRGRPKKTVPELYMCDAPEEHPEIMAELRRARFTQEGENVSKYSFKFDPVDDDIADDWERGFTGSGDASEAVTRAYSHMQAMFLLEEERHGIFGDLHETPDFSKYSETYRLMTMMSGDNPSLKEALTGPERDLWIKAMFIEIQENIDRGSFRFALSTEAIYGYLIDAVWVLRKKFTSTGDLEKLKARICARGFTQRKGIDYNETTATTARAVHWRILMALAALHGWHIMQIDFIAAYLNGKLKEKLFMKMFPLLKEYFDAHPEEKERCKYDPSYIIQLMNPLYGLKQAGATWQARIKAILKQLGFIALVSDDAIYLNPETGDIIASYVDDFLLFSADKERLTKLTKAIAEIVTIKDLGEADWFLGVRIVRSSPTGDVRLDQQQYIERSLRATDMDGMKPSPTPFVPDHKQYTVQNQGTATKDETFEYASLVGRFNFSSCVTRPDTAYTTSTWARFMSNPSPEHIDCIKRLPRYMSGTTDLSIRYRALNKEHPHYRYNSFGLFGAVDSSYGDSPDSGKSTTGYVFYMAGAPVAWISKLQTVVTRCTTEAEYVALGAAAAEAAGIRNFLQELGLMPEGPITLLEDNTGALKWAEETAMSKKKRHIRIDHHYVRQEVSDGHIKVQYIKTGENPADGFTKPLDREAFGEFVAKPGLESVQKPSEGSGDTSTDK